jgi:glutathione synthase/RimK-type ligase-like ATP-grasp enzyme
MKKVLILFGESKWKESKPFNNKDYQYSYEYFYSLCRENGVQMYRASYQWYDYEKHIFKYAWIFEGKNANWKRVRNIRPDLVYDKTKARMEVYYKKELIAKHYPFINDLNFTKTIDDKFVTGIIFPKWSKKNWLIKNKEDLKNILPYLNSKKIVIKPLIESGGNGVQIIEKKEALKKALINRDNIAQEFIDSSSGVPGVSKKMHDLRTVFVNDKLIYAYIREPKKGSYLANLAQGGTLKIVAKNKIPKSIFPIISYVSKTLETFNPRIYSIDFMFDEKKKPWIVELNSMPGLFFTPEEKPYMIEMYKDLLSVFKTRLGIH